MVKWFASANMSTESVRREASSISDLNQAITIIEWITTEGNRAGCKLDIFKLVAIVECAVLNSFEGFVADDALEGRAKVKRNLFDDFEVIGESYIREGVAILECCLS